MADRTKISPELNVAPALMANAHMVGVDEDTTMLTFVQSVPKYINEESGTVTVKYEPVANIALSNRQARLLAEKILSSLKEAKDHGPNSVHQQ